MKKVFILLTLFISIVSCSTSNNDFCECDYMMRDPQVVKNDGGLWTFKGETFSGSLCDMLNGGIVISEHWTIVDGEKTESQTFFLDGTTVIKESVFEGDNETKTEFFLNGKAMEITVYNNSDRVSKEVYWFNGNIRARTNYSDEFENGYEEKRYNSKGELIED